jgi:hypothetical protein
VGGKFWNEALQNGCATADTTCIRNYIFRNHNGQPGVTRGADDAAGNATGVIVGQSTDPVANFRSPPSPTRRRRSLNGAEVNVQHMFGNSGFGVSANYTYVHSGLKYNNASIGEQFALVGLSNSSNVVGIYENEKWRRAWPTTGAASSCPRPSTAPVLTRSTPSRTARWTSASATTTTTS